MPWMHLAHTQPAQDMLRFLLAADSLANCLRPAGHVASVLKQMISHASGFFILGAWLFEAWRLIFPLHAIIKDTIEDTVASLQEYSKLGPYLNWVDALDNVCKNVCRECYVTHLIYRSQWEEIMSRFPI